MRRDLWRTYKESLILLSSGGSDHRTTVFVQGCQRSGTSMMTRVFERDRDTRVFWETPSFARQYAYPSFDVVEDHFYRGGANFVVAKPLIDMHKLPSFLAYFRGKAIWMYRDYRDVVASNLARFGSGNGFATLEPILAKDVNDWKAKRVRPSLGHKIRQMYADGVTDEEAAALFWYVRNDLYFDMTMDKHPHVMLNRYETMVEHPQATARRLYEFIGRPYPGDRIIEEVRASSIGKGASIRLSPKVDEMCVEMFARLKSAEEQERAQHAYQLGVIAGRSQQRGVTDGHRGH